MNAAEIIDRAASETTRGVKAARLVGETIAT
jgi:hypothetical protein